jgi:serine protease Do
VSAIGRHIGAGPYDKFIQTDASINPGNSGGPLINLRGEVVGINTAIFSQSGENIGIGFATPINLAKEVIPQLETKGQVTRGWLGISIQQVTPAIAGPLGMDQPRGALVADIAKDGPAARAGIKVGDVIVNFDGRDIKEASDLPILVAQTMPEKQARVTVLRAKKEIPLFVTIGKLKEKETIASATAPGKLGMTVEQLTPQLAQSLGLSRGHGVILTFVEPGGPADDAGLRQGDLVLTIAHKPIRNLSDYRNALAGTAADKNVLLLIRRGQESMFVAVTPAAV